MAYQRRILSDSTPTSLGSAATVLTGGYSSDHIDIWNFDEVDFFIEITNKSSATEVSFTVEYAHSTPSSADDWTYLHTESIVSGSATQNIYSPTFNLTDYTGTFILSFNVPTRGRYMRINIVPDSQISGVTFSAMRRV